MDPYLQSLTDSVARFRAALAIGPVDAPVAACPGWDLAELARHLGFIQRWARLAAVTGERPDARAIQTGPSGAAHGPVELDAWLAVGAEELIRDLEALPLDAPTWHPFGAPQVAGFWRRRQANEALVHAWDAEHAVGMSLDAPLERALRPAMCADGIEEYFSVVVPRIVGRANHTAPIGTLLITAADTGTRLVVESDGTVITVATVAVVDHPPENIDPTGELRGSAQDLLLALWGRRALSHEPVDGLAADWLAFGRN